MGYWMYDYFCHYQLKVLSLDIFPSFSFLIPSLCFLPSLSFLQWQKRINFSEPTVSFICLIGVRELGKGLLGGALWCWALGKP